MMRDATGLADQGLLSYNEKRKILEEIGQPELIDLFNNWRPRTNIGRPKKIQYPADQRIAISVTKGERINIEMELNVLRKSGERITPSRFIRDRAVATLDVEEWAEIARQALATIDDEYKEKRRLQRRRLQLLSFIEDAEEDEEEDLRVWERDLVEVRNRIVELSRDSAPRENRLVGRLTLPEAELCKWRAARLCLSVSDYLRFIIFGQKPNSIADRHMSIDARKRFYVAILDVAVNGWGTPPPITDSECYNCSQLTEQNQILQDRIYQLEAFLR